MQLISSPLQGFTDYRFRNLHQKYFGGIDVYYAPYIKVQSDLVIKNSYKNDILPENNSVYELIPQLMTKDKYEFVHIAKYTKSLGYKEVNWNLGCPYPMVAKRGMGSGLIKNAELVNEILEFAYSKLDISISIKMRLGYEDVSESFELMKVLNKYPLSSIGIHARLGNQMYKGSVNIQTFNELIKNTHHNIMYNGDINSYDNFLRIKEEMPSVSSFMLGRGIISDPFLARKIKNNSDTLPSNYLELFSEFHSELLSQYSEQLSGDKHIIIKMNSFWEYFKELFPQQEAKKHVKKIKKSKLLSDYNTSVNDLLSTNK